MGNKVKFLMKAKEGDRDYYCSLNQKQSAELTYELKYDGSRHFVIIDNKVTIMSERKVVKNDKFPHLVDELKKLNVNCVLDCEIYVEGGSVLDLNRKDNWDKAKMCVFDIIENNNDDVTNLSFKERKEMFEKIIEELDDDLIHKPKRWDNFDEAWNFVEDNKLEGLMVKRLDEIYYKGLRRDAWTKLKRKENCDVEILRHEEGSTKGVFIVEMPTGVKAKVSGTSVDIVDYWKKNKPKYMEISYMFITKEGKPFQPVFEKFVE